MRETAKAESQTLLAGDVREYLYAHPEFLSTNSDLLTVLTPPRQRMDDSVRDFQHYMLANLQKGISRVTDERDYTMQLLQDHLNRQSRMHVATLSILEADSFRGMIRVIEDDMPLLLDHEAVELIIEDHGKSIPGLRKAGRGFVEEWLPNRDIALEENIHGVGELFGSRAHRVRSQALVKLNISSEVAPAMLALGHRDPSYYAAGLATDQVLHVGSLIELCTRKWLNLPV